MRTLVVVLLFLGTPWSSSSASPYHVRIGFELWVGTKRGFAFDLTSCGDSSNSIKIANFQADGKWNPNILSLVGGPITGDLDIILPLAGVTADSARIRSFLFLNAFHAGFDSLGTFMNFSFDPAGTSAPAGGPLDQFSFFLLSENQLPMPDTSDSLAASALFTYTFTGDEGGELSVFSPMVFVPPDSLVLSWEPTSVPESMANRPAGRLRFLPTQSVHSAPPVRIKYEVPDPGGEVRLRIYDVSGRLVQVVLDEPRPVGSWTTEWQGTNRSGRLVASGVYLAHLEMRGQSVVRKLIVAR